MQDQAVITPSLRPWQHGAAFLLSCAVLILRRPDAVLHPQFFAEDGHIWFADAYNFGWWTALFRTQDGYFQTLPRLGSSVALLVPFALAPLVLILIAIAVQALPVNLLLWSGSSNWGSLPFRAILAGLYLALPDNTEISWGITEAQWPLALCAFLLLVASVPCSAWGRLCINSVILLCGLTGPFCALLLPAGLFLLWKTRDRKRLIPAVLLAACCLIQAWELLIVNPAARSHYAYALGASPALFVRILGGHIYLGALLGGNGAAAISATPLLILLLFVAIGGTAMVVGCFIKSPVEMRLFIVFSSALFAVSLISPNTGVSNGESAWVRLSQADSVRYWFFPSIAFAWSLLWCFRSRVLLLRIVSSPLLLLMCFGIVRGWHHAAFSETHFAESVKRFEAAPPGTTVTIPEYPEGWSMQLMKRARER
jgi:hypothetical protein